MFEKVFGIKRVIAWLCILHSGVCQTNIQFLIWAQQHFHCPFNWIELNSIHRHFYKISWLLCSKSENVLNNPWQSQTIFWNFHSEKKKMKQIAFDVQFQLIKPFIGNGCEGQNKPKCETFSILYFSQFRFLLLCGPLFLHRYQWWKSILTLMQRFLEILRCCWLRIFSWNLTYIRRSMDFIWILFICVFCFNI